MEKISIILIGMSSPGIRPHEWQQIDQGIGYCMNCPATSDFGNTNQCVTEVPTPKLTERDRVELIKVRRELLTLARRIDILVKGQEQA